MRLPAGPSRHRVAVWRELRRIGALSLGQGTWAVPDVPVFADGLARASRLAGEAGGEVVTLAASGRTGADALRLKDLFAAARTADWTEFLDDCDKYQAELAKEIRTAKFLTARDVFGSPQAPRAAERLKQCAAACEDYAERVFAALHQSPEEGG